MEFYQKGKEFKIGKYVARFDAILVRSSVTGEFAVDLRLGYVKGGQYWVIPSYGWKCDNGYMMYHTEKPLTNLSRKQAMKVLIKEFKKLM